MSTISTNQSVLITGASSGIGYATAEYYLANGWIVYGLSRSGKVPTGVHTLIADINKREELDTAIEKIWTKTGRLDAVVHAAGIGGAGPLESFPLEEAQKIMGTNFLGSINIAQASLPYLRKQSKSHLIFISSIAGLMGVPFHAVYSASKFATEAMIECLRYELTGSNIRVVSVCPGDTNTPIIGHQYRSKKEDMPSFYVDNFDKVDLAMRESVNAGIPPIQVAKVIFKATSRNKPRVRYFVGDWLQKIAPYIKRVVPSRLFEKIMSDYYGLK